MSNFTKRLNAYVAAAALASSTILSSGTAIAATQGTLGATSTGTLDITITKADQAQITSINDINLGAWTIASSAPTGFDDICVYTSTGSYEVTTTSANFTGANYRLYDGSANYVVYTVSWNDATGGGGAAMTHNTAMTGQTGNSASATCGGSQNASVQVDITNVAMAAAVAGTYTDTLTMVVAPE
jgi:uncharacterized protein YdbL (DUF1318 family)